MTTLIGTPGSIPTPSAGEVQLFLDSTNNNILSYKDENGNVFIYSEGNAADLGECCACEISKNMSEKLMCALTSGMMTATEWQAAIDGGIKVTAIEQVVDGVKTCSVEIKNSGT